MKNACRPDWQTEFADQIDDLLHTPAVQNLQYYPHHHRVTRYEHVLLVAQLSFRIARAWDWTAEQWLVPPCSMTCITAERMPITYATPAPIR